MSHEAENYVSCQQNFPGQDESQWEGCSKCSRLYVPRVGQYVCDDCLPSWNLDVDRQAEVDQISCLTRRSVSPLPKLRIAARKKNTRRVWIPPVVGGGRMSPPPAWGTGKVNTRLQQAEGRVRQQIGEGAGQVRQTRVVKKGQVNFQPVQGKGTEYQHQLQGAGRVRHKQVVMEGRVKYQQAQGEGHVHRQQEEGNGGVRQRGDGPRRGDKRGRVVDLDYLHKDSLAVGQGVTWAQVVKGLSYNPRNSTSSWPKCFYVVPIEMGQVVQRPAGGGGHVEGLICDQVLRGTVGGQGPDARELQPEEVIVDLGPTVRRHTVMSMIPVMYKDYVNNMIE